MYRERLRYRLTSPSVLIAAQVATVPDFRMTLVILLMTICWMAFWNAMGVMSLAYVSWAVTVNRKR